MNKRPWLTYTILAGGALTALLAYAATRKSPGVVSVPPPATPHTVLTPATAAEPAPPPGPVEAMPARRPRVELVFALDTTGSMTGLIEGAKRKIWSLASFVARGQPTPDLRVGLIAYRDRGDAYVTRVWDLDDDLDRVYARLRQLRADGGGDTPEHVARALHESVHRMSWSSAAEVVKVIYLVGDAPPHTDYDDGFDYRKAARAAAAKGIEVHTIRCGDDPSTEAAWRRIAALGRGQFLTIGQDGGMRDEHTPYDEELARLHDRLSGTAIAYGAGAAGLRAKVASAAAAPLEVKAARAGFMASKEKAVGGEGDLVEEVASGAVNLDALPAAALPDELRGRSRDEQRAVIDAKKRERASILGRISELTRARERHLEATRKSGAKGFDDVAKESLRKSVSDNALSGLKL